jgi:hypothetical protein
MGKLLTIYAGFLYSLYSEEYECSQWHPEIFFRRGGYHMGGVRDYMFGGYGTNFVNI